MLSKWSNFLVEQNIIAAEDAEIQEYGLFSLLETLTFHAAQLIAAFFLGIVAETLLFDVVFLTLRSYAGGYHASTPRRCFLLSLVVWVAVMAGCFYLPNPLCIVLGVAGAIGILFLGPIPHENNPLSDERLHKTTRILRALVVIGAAACVLLFVLGWQIGARLVLLSMFSTACSLAAARKF